MDVRITRLDPAVPLPAYQLGDTNRVDPLG
jgi:hypothetical protein